MRKTVEPLKDAAEVLAITSCVLRYVVDCIGRTEVMRKTVEPCSCQIRPLKDAAEVLAITKPSSWAVLISQVCVHEIIALAEHYHSETRRKGFAVL